MKRKKIIILGGGYGGLAVMRGLTRRLRGPHYSICMIDESPFQTIKTSVKVPELLSYISLEGHTQEEP